VCTGTTPSFLLVLSSSVCCASQVSRLCSPGKEKEVYPTHTSWAAMASCRVPSVGPTPFATVFAPSSSASASSTTRCYCNDCS
jgi:hypothetical protein